MAMSASPRPPRRLLGAALALWLCAGVLACSPHRRGDESDDLGRLELGVSPPAGVTISRFGYLISGPFLRQSSGSVEVPRPSPPVLLTIPGLMAGRYQLHLDAKATAGESCRASAGFVVTAGRTTRLMVTLECGLGSTGMFSDGGATSAGDAGPSGNNVQVNVTIDTCPVVSDFSVEPKVMAVGASAAVSARATDEGDDPPGLQWSAASGSFDDPHAPATRYHCLIPGVVTVAFIASDRHCQELLTENVTCLAADGAAP
jgi:hypothetical protein